MDKQKKITYGIIGLAVLFVLVYIIGIFYYGNRFLPNTYINDVNYGNKTLFEVKNNLENATEDYALSLIKNDGTTEEIAGSDFDYKYELTDEIDEIKANQSNVFWLFSMGSQSNYTLKTSVTYNEEKLLNEIKNLNCLNNLAIKEPTNAYIEITDEGIKVVKEDNGNKLKETETINAIVEAVKKGKDSINLNDAGCYYMAEITSNDPSIQKVIKKVNETIDLTITFAFGEEKETINSDRISSWIVFDEENNISFDETKIKQYVKNLAAKYDTYGKTRKFKTTAGDEITLERGILGWQIDVTKTIEHIVSLIKDGNDIESKPKYELYCLTRENDDIGNTYIEVSIEKQHLWFYKDGELKYESDVVTGLPNGKRDTPKGAFCVWSREKGATLGQYADEGYEVWVDYWMPFDWTGCGLHDSNKSAFGGNIYKTSGSHGCVNLPRATAKFLYENIKTGTPVLIY